LHRILELRPDSPDVCYNMACVYSRWGRVEESVAWLRRAVEKGFSNRDMIRTDEDLENIRDTEYYRKLVGDL